MSSSWMAGPRSRPGSTDSTHSGGSLISGGKRRMLSRGSATIGGRPGSTCRDDGEDSSGGGGRVGAGWRWLAVRWQRYVGRLQAALGSAVDYIFNGPAEAGPDGGAAAGSGAAGSYETHILEESLQKIGALLAVGFGDAGAEIIAENIRKKGDLNPMVPGRKTVAVFGFCDIRNFTDTTEVRRSWRKGRGGDIQGLFLASSR